MINAYVSVIVNAYVLAAIGLAPILVALALFGGRIPKRTVVVVWGWAAVTFVTAAYVLDLVVVYA